MGGKQIRRHELKGINYRGFETHSFYKNDKTVIVSKDELTDIDDSKFFQPW